jgi:hypothetical protein
MHKFTANEPIPLGMTTIHVSRGVKLAAVDCLGTSCGWSNWRDRGIYRAAQSLI